MWETLSASWQSCLEEAWFAFTCGHIPIGAAINNTQRVVLVRAGNRVNQSGPDSNSLAHAEMNALLAFDYIAHDPNSCVLYTTTEPCPLCLGALYMSGIRELHYAAREPFAGSTNLLGKTSYLSRKPIRAYGLDSAQLELILMALYVVYDIRKYGNASLNLVIKTWESVRPGCLAFGEYLARAALLEQFVNRQASAAEVFNFLYCQVPDKRGL